MPVRSLRLTLSWAGSSVLAAGTDITVSTCEEHQGPSHNSRRAPFLLPHLEMRVHFPPSSGKESRLSRRTSRGGSLNLKVERNSKGRATIPKVPMSQSTPDIPDSPALTRLSPRVSTQNMVAGVTALWHVIRKPQILMATRLHSPSCLQSFQPGAGITWGLCPGPSQRQDSIHG